MMLIQVLPFNHINNMFLFENCHSMAGVFWHNPFPIYWGVTWVLVVLYVLSETAFQIVCFRCHQILPLQVQYTYINLGFVFRPWAWPKGSSILLHSTIPINSTWLGWTESSNLGESELTQTDLSVRAEYLWRWVRASWCAVFQLISKRLGLCTSMLKPQRAHNLNRWFMVWV